MRDGLGRVQTVLVLGGGSDIARATVHRLLDEGGLTVILAARAPDAIDAQDLQERGAVVERVVFDARATETHSEAIASAFDRGGDIDVVLAAFGVLGDQAESEADPAAAVAVAQVNFVGAVSALSHVLARLREQGHGTIVVLSSIAGQRARRSNYVYGASKAGLDAFAQGLQLSVAGETVRVVIVRPGFVRSKMTAGMPPAPFSVSPEAVGTAIVRALRSDATVIWVPPLLRWIAALLRVLPARALARL